MPKPSHTKIIRIAVAGKANVGKTSLIDSLTNHGLRVGNFHGTTVDVEEIFLKEEEDLFCFYDTPGLDDSVSIDATFSDILFCPQRKDQELAVNFLKNQNNYDILVYVADAGNLAAELYAIANLKALEKPVLLVLNFLPELKKEGFALDAKLLEKRLGITVINPKAQKRGDILKIIKSQLHSAKKRGKTHPPTISFQDIVSIINKSGTPVKAKKWSSADVTRFLDSIFLHKIFGIPIFIAIMTAIFYSTFTLGEYPAELISDVMTKIADKIHQAIPNSLGSFSMIGVKAFFKDGIVAGTKAVMEFIPKILIMTFFILLIELTGYMPRISMLFYKSLRRFGLHGQSVIPLTNGFGCTVPAILSTRILPTRADRFITTIALSFIPCHAKMLVFLFFSNIFFQEKAPLAMLIIYVCGISFALIAAKATSAITSSKRSIESFESINSQFLPPYKIPSGAYILRLLIKRCKSYAKGVFTTALVISGLIWILANTPLNLKDKKYWEIKNLSVQEKESISPLQQEQNRSYLIQNSIIGRSATVMSKLFAPMDMDWRLCASLVAAFGAKEIAITAISILYAGPDGYLTNIKKEVSIPTAAAYIAFLIIWVPCLSAIIAFHREKSSRFNTFVIVSINSIFAWIFSFLVYQVTILTF